MFDFVRNHQKFILITLSLLVIPSFVVVGAWDLVAPGSDANTVARVGKYKIQYRDWEQSHQSALDNARAQFGGRIDPKLLDTPASKQATLNDLVNERVLLSAAVDLRIVVSDDQIRQSILRIPTVQKDGKFDMDLYQRALKSQGLTPESFEQRLREDIMVQVMPATIGRTTTTPRAVARYLAQAALESRTVRVRRYSASEQMASVSVSDAEVEAFYQSNQARFQTPEEADISIIAFPKPGSADQVEAFSNAVYEQSESLEPASKKSGLPIQAVTAVTPRGVPADRLSKLSPEVQRALSNGKLLGALFSRDAVVDKRNTDAIELAPGVLASARIIRHRPAAPVPLALVRAQIERELREQKASEKASSLASAAAQEALANKGQLAGLSSSRTLVRSESSKAADLGPKAVEAIFGPDLKTIPAVIHVPADPKAGGMAWVIVVESARVPDSNAPEVNGLLARQFQILERAQLQDTLERWLTMRRDAADVELFTERLAKSESR